MRQADLVRLLVLTDRTQASRPLPEVVSAAVAGGARRVVLREKDLPWSQRWLLAQQLLPILAAAGGQLILAGPLPVQLSPADLPRVEPSPVDPAPLGRSPVGRLPAGVHLAAGDAWPQRRVGLIGRSCHTLDEVTAAAVAGADYATLSPVFPSRSKPGYGPPLGVASLHRSAPIPVYALGGVETPQRVRSCRAAGAAGVAVMGAVMRAGDPAAVVAALLAAAAADWSDAGRSA